MMAVAALLCAAAGQARADALLLIEADSGKVLYADNATHPWYPASVTKLMTTYVTLRAVRQGRLTLDTLLTVSANAAAQAPSKMGFKPGTTVTVDNALKMLMVKSANDIAVVLAEGVSGSIEEFADEMNRAAARLGMTQTSYVNPNGLPADGQVTSARDQAILARAMIRELPEYDLYWHVPAIKFGKRTMRNYNKLIGRYPGADGMKTGFICASGFNVVASATRNGRQLIAVVFGAPSGAVRSVRAAELLERGFNTGVFTWLAPSLGTVERLTPVNAAPPDLRDEMCGPKRKRPAAESEDDDHSATTAHVDSGSPYAINLSNLRGSTAKPSSLLGAYNPSIDPIVVFTGPPKHKKGDEPQVASRPGKAAPPLQLQRPQTTTPAFAATPPAYPSTSAFTPTRGLGAAAANRAVPMPLPRPAALQASAASKPKPAAKPKTR